MALKKFIRYIWSFGNKLHLTTTFSPSLSDVHTLPRHHAHREGRLLDAADVGGIKLRKRKALAAEVFQGRAYHVEFLVVDDEKAVMERFVVADGEFWVLGVEGLDVGIGNLSVRHVLLVVML